MDKHAMPVKSLASLLPHCYSCGVRWLWSVMAVECDGCGVGWLWSVMAVECDGCVPVLFSAEHGSKASE